MKSVSRVYIWKLTRATRPNISHHLAINWRGSHKTLCDVVCFSSDLKVNIGSIRPEGRAPKTIDIAIAQYHGRCQSTSKTFPYRSVCGLPCINLENKNYCERKRVRKKSLFQMTDIRPCVGTLWHGLTSKYKHNLRGY